MGWGGHSHWGREVVDKDFSGQILAGFTPFNLPKKMMSHREKKYMNKMFSLAFSMTLNNQTS